MKSMGRRSMCRQVTIHLKVVFIFTLVNALALSSPLAAQRERPNIDSLSTEKMAVLQAAMAAIKALPAENPMSYVYLQETHDGLNGPCEHNSEVFLPWHRELMLRFENALRASGVPGAEDIVLPYWDWSKPPSGQRYPATAEDTNSEFYHAGRHPPGSGPLPLDELADAMDEKTWFGFGGFALPQGGPGKLERPPHNYMHSSYVAGDMQDDFTAARDPLFWLFHTGIDYFWWQWQQTHPGAAPFDPSYPLRGFAPKVVIDVWETAALGYTYAETTETGADMDKVLLHSGFASTLRAMSDSSEDQTFESFGFDLTIPDPGFTKSELLISDVKLAGAGSYTARYYVHPSNVKYSADNEGFKKKYLAAMDAHFGGAAHSKHAHGHHPPKADIRINVTRALTRIAKSHAGETWRVTAVYEGPRDRATGKPSPVLLRRDVYQGAIHLVLDE